MALKSALKAGALEFLTLPFVSVPTPSLLRSASPVFVVSSGRTGTQTLIESLRPAPGVWALHEPRPHGAELSRLAHQDWSANRQFCIARFLRYRAWRFRYTALAGKTYVESTNMQFLAPGIAEIMPGARFVFMYRHPADFVRSGVRRGWYRDHPWDRYRIVPRPDQPAHELWDQWGQFEKICWQWAEVNNFLLDFCQSLPPDRYLTIKFEDFVTDPDGALRGRVSDFMELRQEDRKAVCDQPLPHSNRQNEGVFPEYRDWSSEHRANFGQIVGSTMDRLGYDRLS